MSSGARSGRRLAARAEPPPFWPRIAGCVDHRHVLAPGERGKLPVMAASMQQAANVFNFVRGVFRAAPSLAELVEGETSDTLRSRAGSILRFGRHRFGRSGV